MSYMFDNDFILIEICSNSFVKIMFNEYSTYHISKVRFWAFFSFKTGSRRFT